MGTNLQEEWKKQLLNKEKRVKLTIISDRFPFPFVMIDEKVLWLGLPLEGARRVQPPYVAARLSSSQVCEYLLKQI